MGLRNVLKKKDKISDAHHSSQPAAPEITFIRSDTLGTEVIQPPASPDAANGSDGACDYLSPRRNKEKDKSRLSLGVFRSSGNRSRSASSASSRSVEKDKGGERTRLSQRLHLSRSPSSSEVVPQDLPEIVVEGDGEGVADAEWEHRATMLARENERHRSRSGSTVGSDSSAPTSPVSPVQRGRGGLISGPMTREFARMDLGQARKTSGGVISSKAIDEDIQEAIRLHEEGDLERSTAMFGRFAAERGPNNPLSQVLYGLALRHGWGCIPDPQGAVHYLSRAASNSAEIEQLALAAGLKKGGAAKGELVLAIFELANCFRHGWGVPVDAVAAKQYYETAANLGDTDAMNEVAWCYHEGFGTKKDKYAAAKYYRLAEQHGNKTLGNSWIWKDKYDPGKGKK